MNEKVKDKEFFGKTLLIEFLEKEIEGFDWDKTIELYSTNDELVKCHQLH